MDIDADAHHGVGNQTALPLQRHLREDAPQLFAIEHQVVGPLDPQIHTADPLHRPVHGHGAQGREGQELIRCAAGPPQDREEQALACRGLKAPVPASPARRLAVRHDHSAVLRPLQSQTAAGGIGGVHRLQHLPIGPGRG